MFWALIPWLLKTPRDLTLLYLQNQYARSSTLSSQAGTPLPPRLPIVFAENEETEEYMIVGGNSVRITRGP